MIIGIRWLASVLAFGASVASAQQVSNPLAGRWDAKTLVIGDAGPGCKFLDVTIQSYDLSPSMNNSVSGQYTRMFTRSWLTSKMSNCQLPGQHTNPEWLMRSDSWVLSSLSQGQGRQRITGTSIGCVGDCSDAAPNAPFAATLRREGPLVIVSNEEPNSQGSTRLRPQEDRLLDERTAADAFRSLLQPLIDGDCNGFYVRSFDAVVQRTVDQGQFCVIASQIKQIIPTVYGDRSMSSYAPTIATVPGAFGPILMVDGDVLVRSLIVTTPGGGGLILPAVLRKQQDGSWRILGLVTT